MRPGELYWSFIEPIWDLVSIYDGPEVFLSQFAKLPEVQQHLFAAHWCQSEIRNGGHHQFFSNATGVLAPEAVEGFRAIGLSRCADTVGQAMRFFGSTYPREEDVREEALAAFERRDPENWDPFTELDALFFDAIEDDGFDKAADSYAATAGVA
ncbi:MAG TPA: DUF4375 domain-containing protein [Thermoanaerobaculia bacterium]